MNKVEMVREFHTKFRQPDLTAPGELPASVASLRIKLIREEADELAKAVERGENEELLDALCDLLYVTYGTAIAAGMGDVIDEAFRRVHESNMAKALAPSRHQSKRDSKWDIVKPEGWTPPDLRDLI